MSYYTDDQLRQIKWILAGILACLVVIALALAPAILSVLILVAVAYMIVSILAVFSRTTRRFISSLRWKASSHWRR